MSQYHLVLNHSVLRRLLWSWCGVGAAYVVIVIVLPAIAAFAEGLIGQCHWQALSLAILRVVLHVDLASKLVPTGKERLFAAAC